MNADMQRTIMDGVPMVTLQNVTKSFGSVVAAKNVSLDVARGELLTLLGPSGCGKTTLLNLIAGFEEPDEGVVTIAGKRVNEMPPHLRSLGMVSQSYALFPHMSVAQNVAFGLRMRNVARAEIRTRVVAALDLVRLMGVSDRRPHQLSGGQQQRVALARALVIKPDVLLLDEPLSALDKNLRAQMQIEIKEIQRSLGVTTIFVTHDQSEALSLSDRIVVLSQGEIQQISSPRDMYRHPATGFVASFIGETNRLAGKTLNISGSTAWVQLSGGISCQIPVHGAQNPSVGSNIAVYVRPEFIRLERGTGSSKIRTVVFQGSYVDLIVDGGGYEALRVRVTAFSESDWSPGSQVKVIPDWSNAYMFTE